MNKMGSFFKGDLCEIPFNELVVIASTNNINLNIHFMAIQFYTTICLDYTKGNLFSKKKFKVIRITSKSKLNTQTLLS